MLAFSLDGNGVAAKDIQLAFRECLLIQLAALSGRGNWIEDARIGNARLGVIGDELIAVGRDPDPGETRLLLHGPPSAPTREPGNISRELTPVASVVYRAILIPYRSVESHTISVSIACFVDIRISGLIVLCGLIVVSSEVVVLKGVPMRVAGAL